MNIASDGADVTCDGKLFQKLSPETLTKIINNSLFAKVDINAENQYEGVKTTKLNRDRWN